MRFGVICEGVTDFITLYEFLGQALMDHGHECDFIDLQPGIDKTSQENCGWANAFLWLERNNLKSRTTAYLGSGLFSGALAVKKCDAIIFVIDADCLDDPGFHNFVLKRKPMVTPLLGEEDRERYLQDVMLSFLELSSSTLFSNFHVCAVAKHNSESWAIGVLSVEDHRDVASISKYETENILKGEMRKLSSSQTVAMERTLKSIPLRKEFCKKHRQNVRILLARSQSFSKIFSDSKKFF